MTERLGPLEQQVEGIQCALISDDAVARVWQRDYSLWQEDPAEVADRLGWLSVAETMRPRVAELGDWAGALAGRYSDAVLLGTGGCAAFAESLAGHSLAARSEPGPSVTGSPDDEPGMRLHILDSTDPTAVGRLTESLPMDDTLFLAASASGTTIETANLLAYFWGLTGRGEQFVAITDVETPLVTMGRQRGFRRIFEDPPDVGSRFAALSWFGLVPAALLGLDLEQLLDSALRMARATTSGDPDTNPALRLAAVVAAGTKSGRDKLTLHVPPTSTPFAAWIGQLLAGVSSTESGILPILDEPLPADAYGTDRLFLGIGEHAAYQTLIEAGHPVFTTPASSPLDLGAEVVRWSFAAALSGAALGVNPFDESGGAALQRATTRLLDDGVPEVGPVRAARLLRGIEPGEFIAIHVWADEDPAITGRLEAVRLALREEHGVAVTVGYGPRCMQGAGQCPPGGRPRGVVLQVLLDDDHDVAIPNRDIGFRGLKRAQATAHLRVLEALGLRAGRVTWDDLLATA